MNGTLKICPTCGKQLPGDVKFCDGCGTSVSEVAPIANNVQQPAAAVNNVPPQNTPPSQGFTPPPPPPPHAYNASAAQDSSLARIISAVLAVLLVLTVVAGVARGAAYNALSSMNVEKLYDEIYDEYGRDNPMIEYAQPIMYYAGVNIDDAVEFLNSRKVKRSIQKVLNSVFDMMLTGNPKKLISQEEVEKLVKSLTSEINSRLGNRLSNNDVSYVTRYIMNNYLYDFYDESDRYVREVIKDFWQYEAPGAVKALRTVMHPTTRAILRILSVLAIAALIYLNRRNIAGVLPQIGIPMIVGGAVSFVFALLSILWAAILADELSVTARISRHFLSGYTRSAIRHLLLFMVIGIVLVAAHSAVTKKNTVRVQ